jgi:hypothetical protein
MNRLNYVNPFLCMYPLHFLQISSTTKPKSSTTLFTPYHLINDVTTDYDSYDVFLPVNDMECSLTFTKNQYPYVENYFVSFHSYSRDNNTTSLMEEKMLVLNYGDVFLGIDGLNVEGMQL